MFTYVYLARKVNTSITRFSLISTSEFPCLNWFNIRYIVISQIILNIVAIKFLFGFMFPFQPFLSASPIPKWGFVPFQHLIFLIYKYSPAILILEEMKTFFKAMNSLTSIIHCVNWQSKNFPPKKSSSLVDSEDSSPQLHTA